MLHDHAAHSTSDGSNGRALCARNPRTAAEPIASRHIDGAQGVSGHPLAIGNPSSTPRPVLEAMHQLAEAEPESDGSVLQCLRARSGYVSHKRNAPSESSGRACRYPGQRNGLHELMPAQLENASAGYEPGNLLEPILPTGNESGILDAERA
jgi:hypothetical protein